MQSHRIYRVNFGTRFQGVCQEGKKRYQGGKYLNGTNTFGTQMNPRRIPEMSGVDLETRGLEICMLTPLVVNQSPLGLRSKVVIYTFMLRPSLLFGALTYVTAADCHLKGVGKLQAAVSVGRRPLMRCQ